MCVRDCLSGLKRCASAGKTPALVIWFRPAATHSNVGELAVSTGAPAAVPLKIVANLVLVELLVKIPAKLHKKFHDVLKVLGTSCEGEEADLPLLFLLFLVVAFSSSFSALSGVPKEREAQACCLFRRGEREQAFSRPVMRFFNACNS